MIHDFLSKIYTAILFAISLILSWGGMIYATNNPDQYKVIGILISLIGYGMIFRAVLRYEKDSEN